MDNDNRNIIDFYKYWKTDAIKADLDTKRHNFSVLISNKFNDFNIGSVIRNANAFLAREVIVYGRKKYDRRGTVGTYNYENLRHVRYVDDLVFPDDALIIGVDNIEGAKAVESFDWPTDQHIVLCFGQEDVGLPQEIIDRCDQLVYISQYGSVRSLNVGCASAIMMYDLTRKINENVG